MPKSRKSPSPKKVGRQPPKKPANASEPGKRQKRSVAPATAQAPTSSKISAPALATRGSKKARIIDLLRRPQGAAISDLTAATGWQPHSARAMLTGIRKDGKDLVRTKDEAGTTHYRIDAEA